ncbi:MAG: 4Fe-4S dicluster domain-containing protein [Desulfovermiculus sp.]
MSVLEEVKAKIKEELPNLDCVIGWKQGFDPLHATPHFMRTEQDVDQLIFNPLCVQNPATYLPGMKDKKIGVLVKGCDNRSVVELLQENLIKRENLVIFGLPCSGAVDLKKVKDELGSWGRVTEVSFADGKMEVTTADGSSTLELKDLLLPKCQTNPYSAPVLCDHSFVQDKESAPCGQGESASLQALEAMTLEQRFDYWQYHLDRCIRCYACRNACPMCVCRDHCIADTREPHWLSQETGVEQKWMFQLIHAMHLAGRCTECGECERACPMDIPILSLRQKLNRETKELFDYEAGVDPEGVPPLLTFKVEEANINERGW